MLCVTRFCSAVNVCSKVNVHFHEVWYSGGLDLNSNIFQLQQIYCNATPSQEVEQLYSVAYWPLSLKYEQEMSQKKACHCAEHHIYRYSKWEGADEIWKLGSRMIVTLLGKKGWAWSVSNARHLDNFLIGRFVWCWHKVEVGLSIHVEFPEACCCCGEKDETVGVI